MYACPIGTYLPALLPPLLQALEDRDQVIRGCPGGLVMKKYFGRYFTYRLIIIFHRLSSLSQQEKVFIVM